MAFWRDIMIADCETDTHTLEYYFGFFSKEKSNLLWPFLRSPIQLDWNNKKLVRFEHHQKGKKGQKSFSVMRQIF